MKIFSVDQIREADKYTIEHEPISSIDLMERAAHACSERIEDLIDSEDEIIVFCGLGNNGGDGLAIARILNDSGYKVRIIVVNHSDKHSYNFSINYKLIKDEIKHNEIRLVEDLKSLSFKSRGKTIIIDAILGSGINKPAQGLIADCINYINAQRVKVISINLPTGLFCDTPNDIKDAIINADYTMCFQFPKLSFMFPENTQYIGEFSLLDIGLSEKYILETSTKNYFITKQDVKLFLKTRNKNAHKGNFGHALIVAGSKGKIGAAVLASKACNHSGSGLVTVHIPACGYDIIQTSLPEVMANVDTEDDFITDNINIEKYNAIGVGPGIGTEKQSGNVLKLLIQNSSSPIVFDADAINILSENKTWLSFIPANSIFTPHIGEFERLVGKVSHSAERLKQQIEFSIKYNVYVVLKGAHTSISSPLGELFFNSTGNPGMATGGSGDVLTGIITSLIAQGYSSKEACIFGVYLHGLAGDFAAAEKTEETMIAGDIIENLSTAFKFIRE